METFLCFGPELDSLGMGGVKEIRSLTFQMSQLRLGNRCYSHRHPNTHTELNVHVYIEFLLPGSYPYPSPGLVAISLVSPRQKGISGHERADGK